MSLCCFSQEQQQQRQSALLATGDRALLVRGPLASSGFCLASCWQAVPLFFAWCWDASAASLCCVRLNSHRKLETFPPVRN